MDASRKKVGVSIAVEVWQAYRMACLQHQLSASKQVEHLIREQLERWQTPQEEPRTGT
jgi:hypothetical protein